MKSIKKALIASAATAMVILSTQAFAMDTHHAAQKVQTVDTSSKAVAYELGLQKLHVLEADTAIQLNKDLGGISTVINTVSLDDGAYVTVLEKMNADGQVVYNGVVNVSVTYAE